MKELTCCEEFKFKKKMIKSNNLGLGIPTTKPLQEKRW